ncbi:MAG TPA: N-6 DNA methylase [Pirellulales bacterium]|nr:N-6 DNA methylase [Pirellulales bacterium]
MTTTATRNKARLRTFEPTLFDNDNGTDEQRLLVEAERILLDVADYVYARTSLKPVSKTLFFISRCLCVAKLVGRTSSPADLCHRYGDLRSSMNGLFPTDDFDFSAVVAECEEHVPRVLEAVHDVCRLTNKSDSLGLVFNTLLRGKFEGGEGLGTFLTPEEVVFPMVDMLLKVAGDKALDRLGGEERLLFGDICGGTGRFVYAIARRLEAAGVSRNRLENAARLFDQSLMAVDLGKLNFLFDGMQPSFERVGDSLIAPQVGSLRSQFLLLATNPPFGAGKYRWNKELSESIPCEILTAIGMRGSSDSADPSELFFFRNLDLLAPGGSLAIVLPDGVVQSDDFKKALMVYERFRNTWIHLAAIVSLPTATFSLGGTVAKTSFLVAQKLEESKKKRLYVAVAHHVGFLKRGKKRADDPQGNDLTRIADEFGSPRPVLGRTVACWQEHESFVAARLMHAATNGSSSTGPVLGDVVDMVRVFQTDDGNRTPERFHVSVLDVDGTGLIDIVAASKNQPLSRGLACRPGDILVSCMNPRIWRVAVVPQLPGSWSCSAEFVVLRPKKPDDAWRISLALHHPSVSQTVQAMAKGTSSSRQRVPKDRVLSVNVNKVEMTEQLADYISWRELHYARRLREARAYEKIQQGDPGFEW